MQNMNLPNYQQLGLPVPFHAVDQNTFNGNLPQGNDRIPQLQFSQLMMQNQQLAVLVIGQFRLNLQSAVNKSYLHAFCYNLLSHNWFQNQTYQQWCQLAVDFFEFLVVAKGYQPQAAIEKAAQRVTEAFLGMAFGNFYQGLSQITPQSMWQGLQTAQQMYAGMQNDIAAFKSGRYNQGVNMNMGAGAPMGVNLPPVSTPMMGGNNLGNYATTSAPSFSTPVYNLPQSSNQTNASGSAYYDEPVQPVKPLQPVEEWSTGPDSMGMSHYNNLPESTTMQTEQPPQVQAAVVEQTDLPIPTSVDQVVVDPSYYQPQGMRINFARPYDEIHNPGGILIKPAHHVDWKRSVGDDSVYSQLHDPQTYCLFYVKFPDGAVKEKFVEWNPQMEYLQHELNDDLRRKAYRPTDRIVAAATPVSTIGGAPVTAEEVETMVKDGNLPDVGALSPILLNKTIYNGATDLEVESMVRADLREMLGTGEHDVLPAHEYTTFRLHQMDITDELFQELIGILSETDMVLVGQRLKELAILADLPTRYYRFINERLTKAFNDYLADSMSITTIETDDFCEDIGELLDYIGQKKGQHMLKILKDGAPGIIGKAATLVEVDEDRGIADQVINFQIGWTLEQLSTLNILTERAVLVSQGTHPTVLEILRGMISRATPDRLTTHRMRLITLDGVYLEVIRGQLIERAVLLKRLK